MAQTVKQVDQWPLQGTLPPDKMLKVLLRVITLVKMTPARKARIDWYPYQKCLWKRFWNWILGPKMAYPGTGGWGYTLYQPLTESYITADVYERTLEGELVNQTMVILASCKPYDPRVVAAFLTREVGPVLRQGYFEL